MSVYTVRARVHACVCVVEDSSVGESNLPVPVCFFIYMYFLDVKESKVWVVVKYHNQSTK